MTDRSTAAHSEAKRSSLLSFIARFRFSGQDHGSADTDRITHNPTAGTHAGIEKRFLMKSGEEKKY